MYTPLIYFNTCKHPLYSRYKLCQGNKWSHLFKTLTDPRRKLGPWSIKFNKLSINFSVPVKTEREYKLNDELSYKIDILNSREKKPNKTQFKMLLVFLQK